VFESGATKLEAALESLAKVARGEIPPKEYLSALYETMVEWADIAQKAKKTIESDEVNKKVANVMLALRNAF
jgi:hypothetical protein